ncbi:SRPBCC domain-containing protein [Variovorax sp. OV329]|uniref:SRPBCC domain-containing protein n=1 Tax=Variovorax sp. OV329 TaxID=1882825 RepID=UPI0008F28069|nr:SRPBCC domain-containing protein [Variovorax sp. OV329]SFM63488.1 Uncharacterized conserved protein YndB, AHSA1/START domain [Variovorax sp. OV329]
MPPRIDSAELRMRAPPAAVYAAFASAQTMQAWLPPEGMRGEMLAFDFREGGGYRLRLVYEAPHHTPGKTSQDADEVQVRFSTLQQDRRIVQNVVFDSEDAAFAGEMRITWTFEPDGAAHTLVTVRCENVPPGIREEDHQAGLRSSLEKLAEFVQTR